MIKKTFVTKSDNLYIQLVRYLFVGGFAFVVDFSIFIFLTDYLGIHYLISNIFAFIGGLLANYLLSLLWVFNNRKIKIKNKEFLIFSVIGIVGLIVSQISLYVFIDLLGVAVLYAKIYATLITFIWNFFARKIILF